ncbi:radical SAM protein [Patescibacteria group bacterium]
MPKEILAKSILTKSNVPGMDYCVNPYVGCTHACIYCYARFMKRFTGHTEKWGTFFDVRINAPEVLEKELQRKKEKGQVWIGSVTDPYQPAEKKYKLTRQVLEVLAKHQWPVAIQTKSDLILRDSDIFKKFKNIGIGVTIDTLDEDVRQLLEPGVATTVERKLNILKKLHRQGFRELYAFIGPVFPYITDVAKIMKTVSPYVNLIYVETLNKRGADWPEIMKFIHENFPNLENIYREIFEKPGGEKYWLDLEKEVEILAKKYKTKTEFVMHGKKVRSY